MALTAKKIGFFSQDNKRAEKLISELFPVAEHMPPLLLRILALRGMVDYTGYYNEDGKFCGFSYVTFNDNMAFILYLAIDSTEQSHGYGSEIMSLITGKYAGREITLNCEIIDDNAENAEQRRRRVRFYERFGLHVSDYIFIGIMDTPYHIMSTSVPVSIDEYRRLIVKYGMSFYKPKIITKSEYMSETAQKKKE